MKKAWLFLLILFLPIVFSACMKKEFVLSDYMSELTETYYQGENENFNASISVGEREIDYKVDGIHGETCDFSLVEVKFSSLKSELGIDSQIIIGDDSFDLYLEYNPLTNTFLGDLGFAIDKNSNVSIELEGQNLPLKKVSDDFAIDFVEALNVAGIEFIDQISSYFINGNFFGEGYLKLLNKEGDNFNQLFWAFTLIGKDGVKFDVVINAKTGEVVGVNL